MLPENTFPTHTSNTHFPKTTNNHLLTPNQPTMLGLILDWLCTLGVAWFASAVVRLVHLWIARGRCNATWRRGLARTWRSLVIGSILAASTQMSGRVGQYASRSHRNDIVATVGLVAWMDLYGRLTRSLLRTKRLWCFHTPRHRLEWPCPSTPLAFHWVEATLYFAAPVFVAPLVPAPHFTGAMVALVVTAVVPVALV